MTPEGQVQRDIQNYLKTLADNGTIFQDKRQAGGFSYKKGIPDIYFVYKGYHVECEVKTVNGQLSTMQEKFQERCERQYNMLYLCPRSVQDVKDFIALIDELLPDVSNQISIVQNAYKNRL